MREVAYMQREVPGMRRDVSDTRRVVGCRHLDGCFKSSLGADASGGVVGRAGGALADAVLAGRAARLPHHLRRHEQQGFSARGPLCVSLCVLIHFLPRMRCLPR
eukprot:1910620-Rhodomonas_salina.1